MYEVWIGKTMNRRIITITVLLLMLGTALSACGTTAVYHDQGYYGGYYYGPPPLAPLHGYRHHYHGHDLVYDGYLGVYIVLGEVNHYYYRGHYYRYDNHHRHWYHRSGFDKSWNRYDHRRPLPPRLVKKHPGDVNQQGHRVTTVKKDNKTRNNWQHTYNQRSYPGLQYREDRNKDKSANVRNGRDRYDNSSYLPPRRDGNVQPRNHGYVQPGRTYNRDYKRNRIDATSRSIEGIDRESPGEKNTFRNDNRQRSERNEIKQGNRKKNDHRSTVNQMNKSVKKDIVRDNKNDNGNRKEGRKESGDKRDTGDRYRFGNRSLKSDSGNGRNRSVPGVRAYRR